MRFLVVGAGGHAKVVVDAIQASGHSVTSVVADPPHAPELLGLPVASDIGGVDCDGFIVAIGDNAARARGFARCIEAGYTPAAVVHPAAVVSDRAIVEPGAFLAAGAIVNIDARICEGAIVNTGATVDHDCVVGAHALIGPTASLCGGVTVGEGALVGAGASVIPGIEVGAGAIVGAGAAVVDTIPARTVWAGVPAKQLGVTEPPQ